MGLVVLTAAFAVSGSVAVDRAEALTCGQIAALLTQTAAQINGANIDLRMAQNSVAARTLESIDVTRTLRQDPEFARTLEFQLYEVRVRNGLASARNRLNVAHSQVRAGEARFRSLEQDWRNEHCDDDNPPPSALACAPRWSGVFPAGRYTMDERRALAQAADRLISSTAADGTSVVGQVRPDGRLVDPLTDRPVHSPFSTPSDPDYIQMRLGMGQAVQPGQIYIVNFVEVRVLDVGAPLTLMQLTDSNGNAVPSQYPAIGASASDLARFAGSYFQLRGNSSVALPLGAALVALSPLARQALVWVVRAAASFGGFTLMRLFGQLMPPENCEFHVELAYSSSPTATPALPNPAAGLHASRGRLRTFDFLPSPEEPQPPTGDPTDLPSTGSGGGGNGVVRISGATCGRLTSKWHWQVFVGDGKSGKGFSYDYYTPMSKIWQAPFGGAKVWLHVFGDRDWDPNSRPAAEIWERVKTQFKQRTLANLAGARGRFIDSDGVGRGRPSKIELKGPLAPGVTRMTVKPGCGISPPTGHSEVDTPF